MNHYLVTAIANKTFYENMKTFKDIEFKTNPMGEEFGITSRTKFKNGYEASVVKSEHSYGGRDGLYELAIFKDGEICYDTPITNDVIGYLRPIDVTDVMEKLQKL
jgi:hypothetical protein